MSLHTLPYGPLSVVFSFLDLRSLGHFGLCNRTTNAVAKAHLTQMAKELRDGFEGGGKSEYSPQRLWCQWPQLSLLRRQIATYSFVNKERMSPVFQKLTAGIYVEVELMVSYFRRLMRHEDFGSFTCFPERRSDRDFMLAAVKRDGNLLAYASEELKADKKLVLKAVAQEGAALKHANPRFRGDREVVLAAVTQNGYWLCMARESLRAERELVAAALKTHGPALAHASDELKDDPDCVLAAITEYPFALEHASDRLRNDRAIAWVAVEGKCHLEHVGDELLNSREFMADVIALRGKDNVWRYLSEEMQEDTAFIDAAQQRHIEAAQW